MNDDRPTHLDLFSGIGGFALAAQCAGFRTVAFCEIEPYCQQVLAKNFGAVVADTSSPDVQQQSKQFDEKKREVVQEIRRADQLRSEIRGNCRPIIHGNIFTLNGTDYAGVDLITGGFPCQPFSCAGKRRGKEDDRHLWPEMRRVIAEARPRFLLSENVPGIIGMELDSVLSDLEAIGYATGTLVVPACAVDARHRRDRVWIVAVSNCSEREPSGTQFTRRASGTTGESGEDVADCDKSGPQRHRRLCECSGEWTSGPCHWPDESEWFPQSPIRRVAHGIPRRVDRLRALGNAIVPQVAAQILQAMRELL